MNRPTLIAVVSVIISILVIVWSWSPKTPSSCPSAPQVQKA